MNNIPEWFTDEIAQKVTGSEKYSEQYNAYYEDYYNLKHNEKAAAKWADQKILRFCWNEFIQMAEVALERQKEYPIDNVLLMNLSKLTNQAGERIIEIAQEAENSEQNKSPYLKLEDSLRSLSEEQLADLWNQCIKVSKDQEKDEILKVENIPQYAIHDLNSFGNAIYKYGNIFIDQEGRLHKRPLSRFMIQNNDEQYIQLRNPKDHIEYSWMTEQILQYYIDLSKYASVHKALQEYLKTKQQ